jgi:hypothetical protein
VKDVKDHRLEDRMESFFLAETLKYLYLIFDSDNFLHNQISNNSHKIIHNELGLKKILNFQSNLENLKFISKVNV